jgi:hypothetical protein
MTYEAVLTYGDSKIPYRVIPDASKTTGVSIHVDPDGSVTVDAPPEQGPDKIALAVQRRARWIVTHVDEATNRFKHLLPKDYVSGEESLYLGRRYMLRVEQVNKASKVARLKGNKLIVKVTNTSPEVVKPIVKAWYKARARDYFGRIIAEKVKMLSWIKSAPPFQIQEMKRQWGSCSPNGKILLNPHLIKAPRPCIEYVVLHELAHLKHHDHSPEFYRIIDRHLPSWQQHKRILDNMVELLHAE